MSFVEQVQRTSTIGAPELSFSSTDLKCPKALMSGKSTLTLQGVLGPSCFFFSALSSSDMRSLRLGFLSQAASQKGTITTPCGMSSTGQIVGQTPDGRQSKKASGEACLDCHEAIHRGFPLLTWSSVISSSLFPHFVFSPKEWQVLKIFFWARVLLIRATLGCVLQIFVQPIGRGHAQEF